MNRDELESCFIGGKGFCDAGIERSIREDIRNRKEPSETVRKIAAGESDNDWHSDVLREAQRHVNLWEEWKKEESE